MGVCVTCGKSAGLFGNECESCRTERSAREFRESRERRTAAFQLKKERQEREDAERKRRRDAWVADAISKLTYSVEAGLPASLTEAIYVRVDSAIEGADSPGAFDIAEVQDYTVRGWEIVGVIPRTIGVALKNTTIGSTMGSSWGAGMGGNVVGAHVLIRLVVTRANRDALEPVLIDYFGRRFDRLHKP